MLNLNNENNLELNFFGNFCLLDPNPDLHHPADPDPEGLP